MNRFFMAMMLAWALFVGLIYAISPARSHEFYDPICCSDKDCGPVKATDFRPVPGGWMWVPTGEIIPYNDSRVRESPDGQFHRCAHKGPNDNDTKYSYCIYIPPMGT